MEDREKKIRRSRQLSAAAAPVISLLILSLFITHLLSGHGIGIHHWSTENHQQQQQQQQPLKSLLARLVRGEDRRQLQATGYGCDISENSIVCIANAPVRIRTGDNIITVYATSSGNDRKREAATVVRPYPLRKDKYLLQFISPVKVLHRSRAVLPPCQHNHQVPAAIFSTGINGNLFHEFNDIIIPLYITTNHLQSRVHFIMNDYSPAFVAKFSKIISRLSSFEPMNPATNRTVHCFPAMILGLKYHDNLALNPGDIPGGYSMPDFRRFLRETYSLKHDHISQIAGPPRLMLISREKTRRLLNQDEIIAMIKGLGFEVIVAMTQEAMNLNEFANTVNSCHVLVGVHGAGLTNELFLPTGALMLQVEPLGIQWAADNYFGNPAHAMGVHNLKYTVNPEESSVTETYGHNHSVVTDPASVYAKGYRAVKAVYLDGQDVRVDAVRFRKTLIQALRLLKT